MNIALIPARGGSKRIPKKNIRDFLGAPIISYSIATALESGLFDEVVVSTDDNEIAVVAKEYGASVPFMRSPQNSNDFATLADVVEEFVERGVSVGVTNICCILPTAPFVTVKLLSDTLDLLKQENADSVRPVVKFPYPVQRSQKISETGKLSYLFPEFERSRSQDLEPGYHDAGLFYWMTYRARLSGKDRRGFVIPEQCAQDIDTLEEWVMAEHKYKILFGKGNRVENHR